MACEGVRRGAKGCEGVGDVRSLEKGMEEGRCVEIAHL